MSQKDGNDSTLRTPGVDARRTERQEHSATDQECKSVEVQHRNQNTSDCYCQKSVVDDTEKINCSTGRQ